MPVLPESYPKVLSYANEFKPYFFLLYQIQGMGSYTEVLDPSGTEFCAE